MDNVEQDNKLYKIFIIWGELHCDSSLKVIHWVKDITPPTVCLHTAKTINN